MTGLQELQHRMAKAVMQPLTAKEQMRRRNSAGQSNAAEADQFIRPNDRLTSFERLEIYNRQYWFRLFTSFEEDFPGLQAVVGRNRFQALMRAYLEAHPSTSFSLRNLGSRLVTWLEENPAWTEPHSEMAIEMARFEWADIEAFDSAIWPTLTVEARSQMGAESRLTLQPHVRLIEAHYAIDDALIAVRNESGSRDTSSNNASTGHVSKRTRALREMKRETVHIAVHRFEDTVYYRRLAVEDYRLLLALQQGVVLGDAIDIAFEGSLIPDEERPAYLQSAFAYWTNMGWFCTPPVDRESKENS
ncbi:MAG: DNA-binding domain-containing protein [Acidobacteriaceae bacterium]